MKPVYRLLFASWMLGLIVTIMNDVRAWFSRIVFGCVPVGPVDGLVAVVSMIYEPPRFRGWIQGITMSLMMSGLWWQGEVGAQTQDYSFSNGYYQNDASTGIYYSNYSCLLYTSDAADE